MNDTMNENYEKAHEHSSWHKQELRESDFCGCFNCVEIYVFEDIEWWTDRDVNDDGQTAICPKCGIDSVIGDASGFPINEGFLRGMNKRWFGGHVG